MNKNTPKITVVTIGYNVENIIKPTMLSVLNQTYENLEYIIIDGASKDSTLQVINNILSNYNARDVRVLSEPDKGIYDAMNKGLQLATGEWIIFMNSGDEFADDKVLSDIDFDNSLNGIYGNAIYVRKDFDEFKVAKEPPFIRWRNMPTTHQAFFLKTSEAKSVGFDMSYKYDADYNMIYQIYKKYDFTKFRHVSRTICRYEAYEGTTMHHAKDIFGETLRIRRDHTLRWYFDYLIWKKKCIFER